MDLTLAIQVILARLHVRANRKMMSRQKTPLFVTVSKNSPPVMMQSMPAKTGASMVLTVARAVVQIR